MKPRLFSPAFLTIDRGADRPQNVTDTSESLPRLGDRANVCVVDLPVAMGTRRELRVERPHVDGPLRATVGRIPADQRAFVTSSGHRLVSTLRGCWEVTPERSEVPSYVRAHIDL
jgi:hypothetical protein